MLKPLSTFAALATFVAAAALAQPQPAPPSAAQAQHQQNLPAVDSMTCDQMQAEMTTDGQVMSRQLDPQFGVEANAMQQEAQEKEKQAMAQSAPNPVCFIPFMAMACAAHQQQQAQQSAGQSAADQARVQAQMNRLNNSMNGLDQARMQAISNRFQSQHCQTPH